jgi:hypothetical protein
MLTGELDSGGADLKQSSRSVTLEMYSVDMKMERQYTEINYSSSDEA